MLNWEREMAKQIVFVQVGVIVNTPEFEMNSVADYEENYHGDTGKQLRQDINDAVEEHISNTMPVVMVNGVEMEVTLSHDDRFDPRYGPHHDIIMNEREQAIFDKACKDEQDGWDKFHTELDRREKEAGITIGTYSMGDLSGPISQLDEQVHRGPAMLVIDGGWGDDGPVYSSVYSNPTNWDMFKLFCEALEKSQDHHHVFLEGVSKVRDTIEVDGEVVTVYSAITGS
jgi:hypothetical protein